MDAGCLGLLLALHLAVLPVGAIEVHTPNELEAANGTDARLKCTFTTFAPISSEALSVTWTFQSKPDSTEIQIFSYHGEPHPPRDGPFLGRAIWDGNINKYDASIMIRSLVPSDNGTYTCHVTNPPDAPGQVGHIQLQVVNKVTWSEMYILGLAVGGASLVIIVLVLVVVLIRYRLKSRKTSTEMSLSESNGKERVREKMLKSSDTPI